jgi:Na+/proline symporter
MIIIIIIIIIIVVVVVVVYCVIDSVRKFLDTPSHFFSSQMLGQWTGRFCAECSLQNNRH